MKKGTIIGIVVAVCALFLFAGGCSSYNGMVDADQSVQKAWGQVENQYQRRADLIPNLVETVKGYAAHESSTFEKVTQARAGLTDAYNKANALQGQDAAATEQSLDTYNAAQQGLGKALSIYVNAVREAYPDLKANTQFEDLQTQLEGTENRIATERGRYTDVVRTYNVAVRKFPASFVASLSGFNVKPQFKADAEAATAPKVSF